MRETDLLHLATAEAASDIVELRDSLAHRQQQKLIQQWVPGEWTVGQVAEQISRNEWWVREVDRKIIATVRIVVTDHLIWPEGDPQAAYIHGLMVDRSHSGQGIGKRILAWAEGAIYAKGYSVSRLDCVASNVPLCQYYVEQGYSERGVVEFGHDSHWFPVRRFEKRELKKNSSEF